MGKVRIKQPMRRVDPRIQDTFLDLNKRYDPPDYLLELLQSNNQRVGLLRESGLSLLKGKKGSMKSTFCQSLTATLIAKKGKFLPLVKKGKPRKVIYVDTEQGKHHQYSSAMRIVKLSGYTKKEASKYIKMHNLRILDYNERLEKIELILECEGENSDVLIIDGIRDLVLDINDSKQAQNVSEKLLRWSDEYNIHILSVLHENKGNKFARGHLGTELVNKSEVVIRINGLANYSEIIWDNGRDRKFNKFGIKRDAEGYPILIDNHELSRHRNKRRKSSEPSPDRLEEVLRSRIDDISGITHTECWQLFSKDFGIGDSKAKQLVNHLIEKGILVDRGNSHAKKIFIVESKLDSL